MTLFDPKAIYDAALRKPQSPWHTLPAPKLTNKRLVPDAQSIVGPDGDKPGPDSVDSLTVRELKNVSRVLKQRSNAFALHMRQRKPRWPRASWAQIWMRLNPDNFVAALADYREGVAVRELGAA